MPFIRTTTNVTADSTAKEALKAALGRHIELISGKAECYLMLAIEDGATMAYQGDMTTPLAMVEVQLLGKSDPKELNDFTAAASKAISDILGISESRIYINYLEFEHWGVGGANV